MDITGRTAFAQEASQINENLFSFRSDIDSIRSANQELLQQSKTASAAEVLKSVGQEVGVRTFNELIGKYGGGLYRYKTSLLNGGSLAKLDESLGETIIDKISSKQSSFGDRQFVLPSQDINDRSLEMTDMTNRGSQMSGVGGDEVSSKMKTTVSENAESNPDSVYSDESFEDFMTRQTQELPRTQSGSIDFEADRQNFQDRMNAQQRDLPEDNGEGVGFHTHAEIGGEDALRGEQSSDLETRSSSVADDTPQPKPEEGDELTDALTGGKGEQFQEESGLDTLGEGAGEGVVEGVGKVAGKVAGKEAAGTGLEGIGGLLDATGIFAPIGALFNVAGAALDVAGLYQVGKGVVDWAEEDILQKPQPSAPQIQLPSAPYTIAQRGMGIVPNMDSVNLPSSVSSGW
jgi:hypothetical protein